jgi:hypothetical protein
MKRLLLFSTPILLVILLCYPVSRLQKNNVKQLQINNMPAEIPEAKKQQVMESYGRIPLSFEANQGQTAGEVNFLSRGNGFNLFLTPTEAVLALSKPAAEGRANDLLRMKVVGANPDAQGRGMEELAAKSNYFIGKDSKKWRVNVSNYGKVKYEAVYPGVDAIYYGNQRRLEYDFVVAPGADASRIRLAFEGAEKIEIDKEGNLILSTKGGQLLQHRPIIYQEENGKRQEIAGGYVLKGKSEVGFEVGAYDASRQLVIDPTLSYSTYLGGAGLDSSTDMTVDSAGNAYLTGQTSSMDFPTLNPFQGTYGGGTNDVFVTKLNKSGTALVFSTYLGGSGDDIGNSIAIDPTGNVYVVGPTGSGNFPTTANAFRSSLSGAQDAFLTKLNPSGSGLLYSSFLGGSLTDQAFGLDVDSSGKAYLSGTTTSANFPVLNGFQTAIGNSAGISDGFVAVLNTNLSGQGSLLYSTYLGGNGTTDIALALVLDSSGNAYVGGQTNSTNFPTTSNGLLTTFGGGGQDGYLLKLNANLSGSASLLYSSYIGGNGVDQVADLAVDSAGNAYLTGVTRSPNYPIKNAFRSTPGGSPGIQDAFVTKVNTNLSGSASLVYSTFLGGNIDEQAFGIAIDSAGNAYVAGITNSTNFPTLNAIQSTFGLGPNDVFVTKLNSTGNGLIYSTFLGGSGDEFGRGIAVDSKGNAYVIGHTTSTNFPTTVNAYQGSLKGTQDAFVVKITEIVCPQTITITQQPANVTSCAGSPATFSVTASGTDLTYQWYKNGFPIPGAMNSSYTIPSVSAGDEGSYDVAVTNICDDIVISTAATLTVNTPPSITTDPVAQTVCSGSQATFSVNAAGTGLSYQWRRGGAPLSDGGNILGVTSPTLTISNVTTADEGFYEVVVSGTCSPAATSAQATLTVNTPPAIASQPTSQTVCIGSAATFSVTAIGTDLTYQWKKNGVNILGANASTFTINSATAADAGSYFVVVSGACTPPVTSSAATLTVNTAPSFTASKTDVTCNGASDGSITLNTTSGTAPFLFSKDGGITFQESNLFNNLASGTYNIVVTDSNNCSAAEQTVTITEPPALMLSETHNNISCFGSSNGSINLSVSGGTPGFSFAWSNGTIIEDLSGLAAGTYSVTVTDANGCTATKSVTITEPQPLTSSVDPVSALICAGSSQTFTASASGGTAPFTYLWSNGATTQSITVGAAGLYSVTITDANGCTTTSSATLAVNTAPVITGLTGPLGPIAKGNSATITVNFTDPGTTDNTVTISWGDTTTDTFGGASSPLSATHTYASAGVYTVGVTVTNGCGASATMSFQFIVIYDPEGGFVTGGGWIDSPAGAYTANPSLTGKANFGFVSKYQHGANVPTGNTEFQFKVGNLNFKSTDYEFLVVAGAKAQFKGRGKVNGSGDYNFLLTATDGQQTGGGGVDKFRIKITDRATGQLVYDNAPGSDDIDSANPQAIGGGSIVIHKQ